MFSQELNIPEDSLHEQYYKKIKETCFTCTNCQKCPFITINESKPDSIDINCLCSDTKTMTIKDYFQLTWLENEIATSNTNNQPGEDEITSKTTTIIDVLSIWYQIIKSTNILKGIFNFNISVKCSYSKHLNKIEFIEYYCNDCHINICEKCYQETEHNTHDVIKLNEVLNMKDLNKKKMFLTDALKIMEKYINTTFNEINHIITDKINNKKEDTNTVNQFKLLKYKLVVAISEHKIINECYIILFRILFKLYETYNSNSCLFYSLLKNIKELSNIHIEPSNPFDLNIPSSSANNTIQSHINNIITKISNTYILTHNLQETFFSNLQSHYNQFAFTCQQISLRCGVNYSQTKKKKKVIKQILLLNNFDFALATSSNNIKIYNPETMKCVQKYSKHQGPVNYLCALGMKYFLSCSDDGSVIHWKYHRSSFSFGFYPKSKSGKRVIKHLNKIHFVISYENENKVIILESDNVIKVFQVNENKQPFTLLKTFKQDSPQITSMVIYKDNTLITLTNSDNSIRFWNINEKRLDVNKTISDLDTINKINSMKLLNDKMLVVGGNNSFVVIDLYENCILWKVNGDDIAQINAINKINDMNFIIAAKQYFIIYRVLIDKLEETKKVSHSQFGNISDLCVMIGNNVIISSTTESYLNKFIYEFQ